MSDRRFDFDSLDLYDLPDVLRSVVHLAGAIAHLDTRYRHYETDLDAMRLHAVDEVGLHASEQVREAALFGAATQLLGSAEAAADWLLDERARIRLDIDEDDDVSVADAVRHILENF